MVKSLPAMQETQVWCLSQEDALERGWLPTPVFLPGEFHGQKLQSTGSQWVKHNRVTNNFMSPKNGYVLIEAIKYLQYWSISPFIICQSKEAWSSCNRHPMTISKDKSLWIIRRVMLTFRRTNINAFSKGIGKASMSFCWLNFNNAISASN